MLHGIDISSYQETFDTAGVDFVFIKSTEGSSYVNPHLAGQVERARDAGCVVGFYHFLWPGEAAEQVRFFLTETPEEPGDLLAVDWETTGDGSRAGNTDKDRFLHELKRLRPDHRALLYCGRSFWREHDTTSYAGDGLWIADYVAPGEPRIEAPWRIHQYTDHPVDKNVAAFASAAEMRAWAGG
ncbi:glycoside hydrolase family 25 protein [Streptomyces sp. NBC_00101]|uniref:glycoside hydrolase family 25 protein n=1 Tax=Streptomyces sp. NBC_00101 TaxID=2975651 RepID=UPI00324DAE71